MTDPQTLKVYAVRNKAGRWFRSVGYGGGGGAANWVDDIMRAKLYQRIGQARARVTFFAGTRLGRPLLVEFSMSLADARVLDESERVAKVLTRKEAAKARADEDNRMRNLDYAKQQLAEAKKKIAALEKATAKESPR